MDTVSFLVVPVRTRFGVASIRCGRLATGQPAGVTRIQVDPGLIATPCSSSVRA